MSNVVSLAGGPAPLGNGANSEVIAALETAFGRAKSGEYCAVAIIAIEANGNIVTCSRGDGYKHYLVAGCEYMKIDLAADK
jgi:hypothetical protein